MAVQYDLIVLGAGPAGTTAAHVAAAKGLRVALIDKAEFPRDKLCGGGVTGRARRYLAEATGEALPGIPVKRFDSVAFFAFGQEVGTFTDMPPIDLVMRKDLDAALVQAAMLAGADVFTGIAPEVLSLDPPTLAIGSKIVTAEVMIAADGANSQIAKALFGQPFDREQIGFALEIEHRPALDAAPLRIDFGAANWGYGWQFPKTGSCTIGVGGVMRKNPDMKDSLRGYLEQLGLDSSQKPKGQFLPFGGFRRIPGKGRVLLAGDAAGLVDPITGEGIAYAIRSGHMAALSVIEAAHEPDRALRLYRYKIRPIHSAIRQARALRPILFHPRFRDTFIARFRASKALRQAYLALLGGETEYSDISRKMIARLPAYILRSLGNPAR